MKRTICIILVLLTSLSTAFPRELGLKTVVIDAGHGGHDPGSVSRDKKTLEKTFTLDISLKLAALIRETYPDVKVILTRDNDRFVPLDDRAEVANRNDADLFISIHVNSSPKTGPNGNSVHILGQSSTKERDLFAYNMDVCQRENSVVLLESDYSTKYQGFDPQDPESYIFMQLMQNAYLEQSLEFAHICSKKLAEGPIKSSKGVWQDPFLVLWKTAMPSVLVEVGFLSNDSDLLTLKGEANRLKIAGKLFEAFREFKIRYDATIRLDMESEKKVTEVKTAGEPARKPDEAVAAEVPVERTDARYGVQVFCLKTTLPEGDPRLLGYDPVVIKSGSLNKYVIGVTSSKEESEKLLPSIRKKYPGAFVVKLP